MLQPKASQYFVEFKGIPVDQGLIHMAGEQWPDEVTCMLLPDLWD